MSLLQLALTLTLLACSGGSEGGSPPAAPDRFAPVTLVAQTPMGNSLLVRVDANRVVIREGTCVANAGSDLLVAQVAPGGAGPSEAELYSPAGSLQMREPDAGFIAYTTADCLAGAPPTTSWVVDAELEAGAAGSVFEWPSAAAQVDTYSVETANGWIAWTGDFSGLGPQLLVGDLMPSPRPPPVFVGAVDAGTIAEISDYGVFWRRASTDTLFWVPAPFAMPATPQPIMSTAAFTTFDSLDAEGSAVYWKADGDLWVFDAARAIAPGTNPRNFGPAEEVAQSGPRVVWTDAGQVYTADITDALSVPQWISDIAFESYGPRIEADWIVWQQCSRGSASFLGCADGAATQALRFFDASAAFSMGINPLSVRTAIPGSFPVSIGAVGVAWAEPGDPDPIYFFNPSAPIVADVNPVEINDAYEQIESLTVMDEGVVWLGGGATGDGRVQFVPRSVLQSETNP